MFAVELNVETLSNRTFSISLRFSYFRWPSETKRMERGIMQDFKQISFDYVRMKYLNRNKCG